MKLIDVFGIVAVVAFVFVSAFTVTPLFFLALLLFWLIGWYTFALAFALFSMAMWVAVEISPFDRDFWVLTW